MYMRTYSRLVDMAYVHNEEAISCEFASHAYVNYGVKRYVNFA